MGASRESSTPISTELHREELMRRTSFNRVFSALYTCAILCLLCRHINTLVHSNSSLSIFLSLSLFIADLVLAFCWACNLSFRLYPTRTHVFPNNLEKVIERSEFPRLDVFICTADPYKEPPMGVVNTALSVMAFDYPTEKLSIYVSDDGGSQLTLFAFTEAARFAGHWLPFCVKNNLVDRSPEAFLKSNHPYDSEAQDIKLMYESLKSRVESCVERGKVVDEYITNEQDRQAFQKWTQDFTRQDHPTVIQVLLENRRDKDITGHFLPNLIYLSRQKSRASPHHFKAGALNTLLRVSATMTNAPILLTLDCDMFSNDPQTPLRALCYLSDPKLGPILGWVQFPQIFHGLNKNDIYACEFKRVFIINPIGMNGFLGTGYVGTGCFFNRRAFFGGPSSFVKPELAQLGPDHIVDKPIGSQAILEAAHAVAGCDYEEGTNWGFKMGFKYGSLVEDYFTGYRLQCEGWRSKFCHPERPAFLGDMPISLIDVLNQTKRWSVGLLEVAFCKYSPITFGIQSMGLLRGLAYAHYALWAIWAIPICIYAFLPQLALLHKLSIFPKVSDPWFLLYVFLFVGAYVQDYIEFTLAQGTFERWWSDQRMWLIRGLSSYLFGFTEYILKSWGISTQGFTVTSKVVDDEQGKKYDQGVFEFGVPSPLFVPLTMTAILNFWALTAGIVGAFVDPNLDGHFVQILLSGFGVLNCLPIYEAMVLRSDKGKLPTKITLISTFLAGILCSVSAAVLKLSY
ncbi:Cellulose synthase [Dillenia turbinata]|uniref:Cellulose synthase n=1 Tax=Dillenia turbinata TaxID=194707 RepID=A0AAN8ZEZ2_9MAGN